MLIFIYKIVEEEKNMNDNFNNNDGFNNLEQDSYYNNDSYYSNNNYDSNYSDTTYEEKEKKSGIWWKILLVILVLLIIILLLLKFCGGSGKKSDDELYAELTAKICTAAETYTMNNPSVIDKTEPGKTAIVKFQILANENLINSQIENPYYDGGLFKKETQPKYYSMDNSVRLTVLNDGTGQGPRDYWIKENVAKWVLKEMPSDIDIIGSDVEKIENI